MPTFFPRRFTDIEFLKTISSANLIDMLTPHRQYLAGRGLELPETGALDYQALISILVNPDPAMPPGLVDGLFYAHEMATPDGMNAILERAPEGMFPPGAADLTPGDVAVQAWLKNRNFLEALHSERFLVRPKSFVCLQGATRQPRNAPEFTETKRLAIETQLDDGFDAKRRGRGTRIFPHERDGELWYLVRHGDPLQRVGTYNNGPAESVYYRPEKFDVVIYCPELDRLAVHTGTKAEREMYRLAWGRHLFGDDNYFAGADSYTLAPLLSKGQAALDCSMVEGIDWIHLKEVEVLRANCVTVIYKHNDLFKAMAQEMEGVLTAGALCRASFYVKFAETRTARVITVRPPTGTAYSRDADRLMVEAWMRAQGFIVADSSDEKAMSVVAGS